MVVVVDQWGVRGLSREGLVFLWPLLVVVVVDDFPSLSREK